MASTIIPTIINSGGGMIIHDITPGGGPKIFDHDAWLDATSEIQPGSISLDKPIVNTNANAVYPIDASRWLVLYADGSNSNRVSACIVRSGDDAAKGDEVHEIFGDVNTAPVFVRKCRAHNAFLIGSDVNSLIYLDCGPSGLDLSITMLATDGATGKAEAFARKTDVLMAEDDSHFVITNEFNNGGTRSFVSALWGLDLSGTPAADYVMRDVTATGSAQENRGMSAYYLPGSGAGVTICYDSNDNAMMRVNKVSFGDLFVSNSVTGVSLPTSITSNAAEESRRFSRRYEHSAKYVPVLFTSGSAAAIAAFDLSGTPVLVPSGDLGVSVTAGMLGNAHGVTHNRDHPYCGAGVGSTSIRIIFSLPPLPSTRDLITGLTSPAVYASALAPDGNWLCMLGKVSTNDGRVFLAKSVNG